jgi:hypothetical protein
MTPIDDQARKAFGEPEEHVVNNSPRILVWFSCGAASAVAWKVAFDQYGDRVEACYCDLSKDEHEDNARFMADVERWVGRKVTKLRSEKYQTVTEVSRGEKYIVGPYGAPCTRLLKRRVREQYQRPDDVHVFGLTADEAERIAEFEENNTGLSLAFVLADRGITKNDCYKIIRSAGLELPVMYRLGFNNANCIGCVKGGMGYWNKIRRHFPDVFRERAETERIVGATSLKNADGSRLYLDELDPNAGRDVPEPDIECGLFCDGYTDLIRPTVKGCVA